jgi:DNA-binding CsgD family transcriptional regulator
MLFQTRWTECLHGAGAFGDSLSDLLDLCGGRAVVLHRTCEITRRTRTVAMLDRGARVGDRPLAAPLGVSLLRLSVPAARPGTLWVLSDFDRSERDGLDERTLAWMADRRLRDTVVVPLDRSGTDLDILEIHFQAPVSQSLRASLEVAAIAASTAWRRRQKGRISRLLSAAPSIAGRVERQGEADRTSPLAPGNPLDLTGAEMRVCVLLRNGHSSREMTDILRISDSTLRTHLRSVYAKVGVSGQMELVRLLLSTGPDIPSRLAS